MCDDGFSINLRTQHILQPLMKSQHPGVRSHYCIGMKKQHVLSFLMSKCHYLHFFFDRHFIQSGLQAQSDLIQTLGVKNNSVGLLIME